MQGYVSPELELEMLAASESIAPPQLPIVFDVYYQYMRGERIKKAYIRLGPDFPKKPDDIQDAYREIDMEFPDNPILPLLERRAG